MVRASVGVAPRPRLALVDPSSAHHAQRLEVEQETVGWLPDYAIKDVDRLEAQGHRLGVEVVRVQPPDGNAHLRLLCRLVVDA